MTNDNPRRRAASSADHARASLPRPARQQHAQQQALNSINSDNAANCVSPATNPSSSGLSRPAANPFNDKLSTTAAVGSVGAPYEVQRRPGPNTSEPARPCEEFMGGMGSHLDQLPDFQSLYGQPGQFSTELDIPIPRSLPTPIASPYQYAGYPPQPRQRFRTSRSPPLQPSMRRPPPQNPPAPGPVTSVPTQTYLNDHSNGSDALAYYMDQANASKNRRKPR